MLVPRSLADDMAEAITAMQVLAADAMVEVALSLSLAARRSHRPLSPPCATCGVDVAIGHPHAVECSSREARRLRSVPPLRVVD